MKIKLKLKSDKTIVQVVLQKNEELIGRELTAISTNTVKNLLKPALKKSVLSFSTTVEYIGTPAVPLTQYLKQVISKQNFFYLLVQIVSVTHYLQSGNMALQNLLLDFRYIFINPSTHEMFFIYLPIISEHSTVDMLGFFGMLLHSVNPNRSENNNYLGEFSNFLKGQNVFSLEAFQSYISARDRNAAAQFHRLIGTQSGFITNKRESYYKHYQRNTSAAPPDTRNASSSFAVPELMSQTYATGGQSMQEDEGTSLLSSELQFSSGSEAGGSNWEQQTTLLNTAFEEGTTVLSSGNSYQSSTAFPYIVRVSTNERYYINKPVYRIGKESRYVDCFISNNGAVSRSHADIISSNGRYFIVDKHTTNHTYINQQVIPEETQMELHDGDMITLANEVFTFHVQ